MLLFSHQVMPDFLQSHGLQHTRLFFPSLSPRVCSDSCPLSQWCYLTIYPLPPLSPFALNISHHLGLFQWVSSSHKVASIGASVSARVLPVNIQGWFLLGLTGLISLLSKGLSRVLSNTIIQKHQFFGSQPSLWSNSHIHTWLLEKPKLWL